MRKLSFILATAGLAASTSLGAYAAVPTGAAPFQVVVPNLKSGLEFTVEGFYLQPTSSNLDYATFSSNNNPGESSAESVSTLDPNYDLGFRVGLGYIFPDSGNDVQLSWTHFDQSSSDSNTFGPGSISIDPTVISSANIEYLLDSDDFATANSALDAKYDAVDLNVGQYLSLGTRLQTRLFAGLRYAELQNNLTNTYNGSTQGLGVGFAGNNFNEVDAYNSKFTGVGPHFGVDMSYHVVNCLGVVGHASAALLVGRVETSTTISTTSTATVSSTTAASADNQTRVVPAFDAKLGLDYSIPFQNDASRLSIEAGYQVTQYLDAIDRLNVDYGGTTTPTTVTPTVSRSTSGMGFNGPYLSLNYKM